MKKVVTIVGTRPEVIKLCRVIAGLDKHFNHVLVHTGQNFDYELNEIFFHQLGIRKPDYFLGASGGSAAETIAKVISKSDEVLEKEQPDAVLIFGDTNSCLSVIAAKRRRIPIFHMEAGNRCFDLRVPEEINRKIVDHLSDINMVISENARRYLIREGIRQETIIKTGSSMWEVLSYYKADIERNDILLKEGLRKDNFVLVSFHREENVDTEKNLRNLMGTLTGICSQFGVPVLVSTHPRTRKRLETIGYKNENPMIKFMKPYGFFEYIKLQQSALCVVSDSGTITEEASILKFPGVNVREAHERPEGMEEGTIIMTGLDSTSILEAMDITIKQFGQSKEPFDSVKDYFVTNVSLKVVKIILSYIGYINRTVWYKSNL